MPATKFLCPDQIEHPIASCLDKCRMVTRCAPLPYLRLIGYDREYRGISPSQAGNGPRLIYLKATKPYTIDPQDRAFAALGTAVHGKLSLHDYNVMAEERLSDEKMAGIADLLEEEEGGGYVLTDFKTWGSYKVAKSIGVVTVDEPVLDDEGKPVLLKSGKNKGQPKTTKAVKIDPDKADTLVEQYQLNRYRMFFEAQGFSPIRCQVAAIVRDGGTYIAKNRGITKNLYLIEIPNMDDNQVNEYYNGLQTQTNSAMGVAYIRKCDAWESWDGRRCDGYCEVKIYCDKMGE